MEHALKALGEGRVAGYLVAWGSPDDKDLHGEYFTPETKLWADNGIPRPMLYHHGLDGRLKAAVVGVINTLKTDDFGVWAEAQLDMRQEYARYIEDLVSKGALGWSSGSLPHLVDIAPDGKILQWPIVEGSLTPTPAQPVKTQVAMKHLSEPTELVTAYKSLDLDVSRFIPADAETAKEAAPIEPPPASAVIDNSPTTQETKMDLQQMVSDILNRLAQAGAISVTPEELAAMAQQLVTEMTPAASAPEAAANPAPVLAAVASKAAGLLKEHSDKIAAAKAAYNALVTDAVEAAKAAAPATSAAPAFTGGIGMLQQDGGAQKPSVTSVKSKYEQAGLSVNDLSALAFYLMNRRNGSRQIPAELVKELAHRAGKAYDEGNIKFGDAGETASAVKSINYIKANELSTSTQATFGDEWVPTLWSSQLWERARLENVIFPQMDVIEMPSQPYELPIEGSDPTVSFVAETANESALTLADGNSPIPDSKFGTGKVTISASKLALRTMFSAELDEDSIIPIIPRVRDQAERAMMDTFDYIIINGDTDATLNTNINLIDGTPAATARYLAFNGLRKLPLITTTTNAIDGGAAGVTLAQLRSLKSALSRNYSARLSDLVYITNPEGHDRLLALPELLTIDKYGQNATILTGEVGRVNGIPVLVTGELGLSNTAGMVSGTGSNNTRTSFLLVYKPYWKLGFRRRMTMSLDFVPYYDTYVLTATARLGMVRQDADCASILYNSLV